MKKIKLTQGKYALVDDEDFEYLNQFKWQLRKGYAVANIPLHKLIVKASYPKQVVDHINRDKLDDRKVNLRIATCSQNQANKPAPSHNTTGFKGVSWYEQNQKWVSKIKVKGKVLYLGIFCDKIKAAEAYNEAAKKYFGEFAYLNKV